MKIISWFLLAVMTLAIAFTVPMMALTTIDAGRRAGGCAVALSYIMATLELVAGGVILYNVWSIEKASHKE